MKTIFKNKQISGVLGVLPNTEIAFEDEVNNYNFPPKQTLRLKKIMGYKTHRVVKETTSTADLCIAGISHILENGWLSKEDIGAIVVATTSPDHFIPPVSNIIQGHFGLGKDVVCLDISQGCVALVMGMVEGLMLLEHIDNKKVIVCAADVLSKKVSKKDRNSYPLIGDGASIVVLENCDKNTFVHTIVYNDGSKGDVLMIPAGGSRMPSTDETRELRDFENDGNLRSLDNLTMKGADVFNFVQVEVPPLIEEILEYSGNSKESIDAYIFHQPNKFMLQKLAQHLDLPFEKVPMNLVENFGNSSGACIGINMAFNYRNELMQKQLKCCLSAFGSGLTWAAMILDIGKLDFCELFVADY